MIGLEQVARDGETGARQSILDAPHRAAAILREVV
jgi:hypothetical protein